MGFLNTVSAIIGLYHNYLTFYIDHGSSNSMINKW